MHTLADFIELRLSCAKDDLQLLGVLSSAFSMKSMTVKELQFELLQLPPSWPEVCRLESFEPSFSTSEPSPSFALFDLLLFFFEDILIVKIFPT